MYVQRRGGIDKILGQIVSFRRSGSLLVSGLTAGIKPRKENVQLLGAHAQTTVDGKPVFYFLPPKQEAEAGVNAGDFVLIRLEEKSKRRQFEIGAQGAWRASSGISITHQIQLFRSETKSGIYTITPTLELGKGEYALYLARGEGMQAYVYDFSVSSTCCSPSHRPADQQTPEAVKQATSTTESLPVKTALRADEAGDLGVAEANGRNSIPSRDQATAQISSDPSGADIEIDGVFVGNTPSTLGLAPGDHILKVSKNGYKEWGRALRSSTGQVKITAVLEGIGSRGAILAPEGSSAQPLAAAGSVEDTRIGIWFSGNPRAKHDGLEVSGVQPGGPADLIDIKPGDVIIALDGHYLYSIDELRAELLRYRPASRMAIRYRRGRLTYDNYLVLSSERVVPHR